MNCFGWFTRKTAPSRSDIECKRLEDSFVTNGTSDIVAIDTCIKPSELDTITPIEMSINPLQQLTPAVIKMTINPLKQLSAPICNNV
jgi:hypothetical protein